MHTTSAAAPSTPVATRRRQWGGGGSIAFSDGLGGVSSRRAGPIVFRDTGNLLVSRVRRVASSMRFGRGRTSHPLHIVTWIRPLPSRTGPAAWCWHGMMAGMGIMTRPDRPYAHHVRANGSLDPAFPQRACRFCSIDTARRALQVMRWAARYLLVDRRGGFKPRVYASLAPQRIRRRGMPVMSCLCPRHQWSRSPRSVTDGAGGVILDGDSRNGDVDLYPNTSSRTARATRCGGVRGDLYGAHQPS